MSGRAKACQVYPVQFCDAILRVYRRGLRADRRRRKSLGLLPHIDISDSFGQLMEAVEGVKQEAPAKQGRLRDLGVVLCGDAMETVDCARETCRCFNISCFCHNHTAHIRSLTPQYPHNPALYKHEHIESSTSERIESDEFVDDEDGGSSAAEVVQTKVKRACEKRKGDLQRAGPNLGEGVRYIGGMSGGSAPERSEGRDQAREESREYGHGQPHR